MKPPLRARIRGLFTAGFHRLVTLEDTPRSIALGAAIGVFIGMTPTYGVQMFIVFIVNSLLRVNRVAGLITIYITNPLTLVPIYWLCYKFGAHMLWQDSLDQVRFQTTLSGVAELPFLEALREFVGLGWDILGPMFVGGLMLGAVGGALTYPIVLVSVIRYKEKRALRRARKKLRKKEAGEAARGQGDGGGSPEGDVRERPSGAPVTGGNGKNRISGDRLAGGAPPAGGGATEEDGIQGPP